MWQAIAWDHENIWELADTWPIFQLCNRDFLTTSRQNPELQECPGKFGTTVHFSQTQAHQSILHPTAQQLILVLFICSSKDYLPLPASKAWKSVKARRLPPFFQVWCWPTPDVIYTQQHFTDLLGYFFFLSLLHLSMNYGGEGENLTFRFQQLGLADCPTNLWRLEFTAPT